MDGTKNGGLGKEFCFLIFWFVLLEKIERKCDQLTESNNRKYLLHQKCLRLRLLLSVRIMYTTISCGKCIIKN